MLWTVRLWINIKKENNRYMSQILDNEFVLCDVCGSMVTNFTFCKTKSLETRAKIHFMQRCHRIVCASCEYCSICDDHINYMKKAIKSFSINIDFSDNRIKLKKEIERLEREHGVVYNGRK